MSTKRVRERLKATLRTKGYGLLGLANSFKEYDKNNDGEISWEEFQAAIVASGLAPTPQDIRALFLELDTDGTNSISYSEFIRTMRGELSTRRREIIVRIFDGIDTDGDGIITMADIGAAFNPRNHPDVKTGRMTIPTMLNKFLETFASVTKNGLINLPQFVEYYANVAAYDDDVTFESTMNGLWNIKRETEVDWSVRPRPIRCYLEKTAKETESLKPSHPSLDLLREQLIARGARGIIGLQRKFRIMDDDGSGALNLAEFKKGIKECGLNVSDYDLIQLFNYFDKDKNGSISFDEFIAAIRVSVS